MSNRAPGVRIVAGIDGTPDGLSAAAYAARIASLHHLPLVLVHAYRVSPALNPLLPVAADSISARHATTAVAYHAYAPGFDVELTREAGAKVLDAAYRHVRETFEELRVERRLVGGAAAKALVAESFEAAMLVVARNHERSISRFFAGSTSNTVSAHAHCPVVVAPTNWRDLPETGKVVVGLDAGRHEGEVLTFAFEEAALRSAQLNIVHAWEIEDFWNPAFQGEPTEDPDHASGRRAVSEALAGWSARFPDVHVTVLFESSSPHRALIEASDTADLVVVGARGQGGLRGLALGSTARSVVCHATCPVAVVRHGSQDEPADVVHPSPAGLISY